MPEKNALDESTEGCARFCGFFLFVVAFTGFILSCAVVKSCEFMVIQLPDLPIPEPSDPAISPTLLPVTDDDLFGNSSMVPSASPSASPTADDPIPMLGIFKYKDWRDDQCYFYETQLDGGSLEIYQTTARLGATMMVISSLLGLCILLLEFCLCRFYCSRTIVTVCFTAALIGVPMTFTVFFDPQCRRKDAAVYTCERDTAANQSLAAGAMFLVVLIMLCFTPKVVPVIRAMDDFQLPQWACFRCCSTSPCGKLMARAYKYREVDVEVDDAPAEMVEGEDGRVYKHYHDETAGLTYQNQYTAAYKRWLNFEADYESALNRFKADCQDADVDWRHFLRKARAHRRRMADTFDDEAFEAHDDEDTNLDEELLRCVHILDALRNNCTFAQDVLQRIKRDIDDQALAEDASKRKGERTNDTSSIGGNQGDGPSPAPSSSSRVWKDSMPGLESVKNPTSADGMPGLESVKNPASADGPPPAEQPLETE
jgi:hypothetical protein